VGWRQQDQDPKKELPFYALCRLSKGRLALQARELPANLNWGMRKRSHSDGLRAPACIGYA